MRQKSQNVTSLGFSACLATCTVLGLVASAQAQIPSNVRVVDQNAPGGPGPPGESWENAYIYLQDALAAMDPELGINQSWVAAGTYHVDRDAQHPQGTGNREASFHMENGVSIYGGFVGNETQMPQRDPETNITILSGELASESPAGVAHAYHVVRAGLAGPTAVINGFTITGGEADGQGGAWTSNGGGMLITLGSPKVVRCTFIDNSAIALGGAIMMGTDFLPHAAPLIVNCSFVGNSASVGGAIHAEKAEPTLANCMFSGNAADNWGGAVRVTGAGDLTPTFINCTFSQNSAAFTGGGISSAAMGLIVKNCVGRVPEVVEKRKRCSLRKLSKLTGELHHELE